jgi:hypothetical protein
MSIDGLPVRTVSEVLALREARGLRNQPVAVRGYWSDRWNPNCASPLERPGALELWCGDGRYGITERPEPIVDDRGLTTTGPSLTPFLDESAYGTNLVFDLTHSRWELPPIAIVARGHFDDPRAADCRPEARQRCLDRLVLDRIVSFDLATALASTPALVPVDFGSDEEPPARFDAADCQGIDAVGFVGWASPEALVLPGDGILYYAAVSKHGLLAMPWTDDPARAGHRARLMDRKMCVGSSNERVGGVEGPRLPMHYFPSLYLERDDGLIIPIGPYAPRDSAGP